MRMSIEDDGPLFPVCEIFEEVIENRLLHSMETESQYSVRGVVSEVSLVKTSGTRTAVRLLIVHSDSTSDWDYESAHFYAGSDSDCAVDGDIGLGDEVEISGVIALFRGCLQPVIQDIQVVSKYDRFRQWIDLKDLFSACTFSS